MLGVKKMMGPTWSNTSNTVNAEVVPMDFRNNALPASFCCSLGSAVRCEAKCSTACIRISRIQHGLGSTFCPPCQISKKKRHMIFPSSCLHHIVTVHHLGHRFEVTLKPLKQPTCITTLRINGWNLKITQLKRKSIFQTSIFILGFKC